jgi:hypothetical protein
LDAAFSDRYEPNGLEYARLLSENRRLFWPVSLIDPPEQMMAEHNNTTEGLDHDSVLASPQNWGVILGVGAVIICMLVMIINLSIFESRLAQPTNPWVQLGRLAGLALSLILGGWLLWRLFNRRPASHRVYLKRHLQKAVHYTERIEQLLKSGANGHEQPLLRQIQTWWQTIEAMARTLGDLSQNSDIIQSDLHDLPGAIVELERQLALETHSLLRADLEQMLGQRRRQQAALEQLQTTRRRAEIQIERTIAVLGTIYSQLLTYRSTFHVADYQQLADNVAEEVQQLQDYLEALQEVKGRSPAAR